MEGVINYLWMSCFNVLLLLLFFCFHFHLFLYAEKWSFFSRHPPKPSAFLSVSHSNVAPLFLTCPSSMSPSPLSAPTPGSKVSCLTVNVLSLPQREATRQQKENYCVLHSSILTCTVWHTHTHTRTYCWLARALSSEFVPNGTYCLSISVSVCGYERSQSQSAVLVWLSMVLNSIFYTLL